MCWIGIANILSLARVSERYSVALHGGHLMVTYPIFAVVMVIYHYIERIWRILITPNFFYDIYDREKYYPGEPVNVHI